MSALNIEPVWSSGPNLEAVKEAKRREARKMVNSRRRALINRLREDEEDEGAVLDYLDDNVVQQQRDEALLEALRTEHTALVLTKELLEQRSFVILSQVNRGSYRSYVPGDRIMWLQDNRQYNWWATYVVPAL